MVAAVPRLNQRRATGGTIARSLLPQYRVATFQFGNLRALTSRFDLSYGTYIYGVPVTQTLLHIWPTISIAALISLTAAIVLPLAFV